MIAVIAAPVVEEILFRGIVLRSMRKFTPTWAAILISSVLFGAYHLNIVQAVYATLMGIAAGILYEKKRNLLFPILVHFANNLIIMQCRILLFLRCGTYPTYEKDTSSSPCVRRDNAQTAYI